MLFVASPAEESARPDIFSLLTKGRELLRDPAERKNRLREQQEESAARSLAAAQRAAERFQWRPRYSVALIDKHVCQNCHSEVELFAGFGVMMYRNSDKAERLVMTPMLDPAFPKQIHRTETLIAACSGCLPSMGFTELLNVAA